MGFLTVAGSVALVVLAITTHEACHGFVADRLGDPTAREQGRLTLNPLPHIDLFFTILLPLFLILSGTGSCSRCSRAPGLSLRGSRWPKCWLSEFS